jgi:hypothetical protein
MDLLTMAAITIAMTARVFNACLLLFHLTGEISGRITLTDYQETQR